MIHRICLNALLLIVIALSASITRAQSTTVFAGTPSLIISEGGTNRTSQNLAREQAVNAGCVISQIGNSFYWASRENRQLIRIESGAFIIYVAVEGGGYIKTIAPGMKKIAALLGDTEAKFDYVEHLLIGLKSVTYYGVSR